MPRKSPLHPHEAGKVLVKTDSEAPTPLESLGEKHFNKHPGCCLWN